MMKAQSDKKNCNLASEVKKKKKIVVLTEIVRSNRKNVISCDVCALACNFGWLVLLNPITNNCCLWNQELLLNYIHYQNRPLNVVAL